MRTISSWRTGSGIWAALALFVLGLLASAAAALRQDRDNHIHLQAALDERAAALARELQTRLERYGYGLRGARGFAVVAGEAGMSRELFQRYSQTRSIDQEFPGARGFGIIRRVPKTEEQRFLTRARADGMPAFGVTELGAPWPERFIIQYVEPVERNQAALGLDIATEALRREAALAAARSGQARLTAPITLVQASDQSQSAFLLLLPIYARDMPLDQAEQREHATRGWSYAPLSMRDILSGLVREQEPLSLSIADTTDTLTRPIYHSERPPPSVAARQHLEQSIYGRRWSLDFEAHPAFAASLKQLQPRTVFVTGALSTLLLTGLLVGLAQAGRHKRRAILERTQLATIVENSSDAIVGEDMQGQVISWNRAAEQMFGYQAREAIGRPLAELLIALERREEDMALLRGVSHGEAIPPFDAERLHRDGRVLDVSVTVAPIHDAAGATIGVAKLMRDNRERKEAERRLQAFNQALERQVRERTSELELARRDLQMVLDSMPSMIGYWDSELRNRVANRAYHVWFGVEPGRMAGMQLQTLLGPELFQANRGYIEAALRGEPQTFERAIPHPDGLGTRHALAHYLPDVLDGQVRGFYVIVHDVTDLKHAEAELRTALDRAQEASAAKSLFLANMSHEIRTPMNALIGIAHLLENSPLNPDQQQLLAKLQIAGRSLLGIINNVLDLAKIEAGELIVERRDFSPRALLQDLVDLFSPQAQAKHLGFDIVGAEQLPAELLGDAHHLHQILSNLIGNALKFTERGCIVLRIKAGDCHQQMLPLRFTVEDSGCGIEAEAMQRIFTPFTQADASITRRYGGTGLGLSIVQRLAQAMGGQAGGRSEVGQGSEFWVDLPFEIPTSGSRSSEQFSGLKAMVVDDDPADRAGLAAMCRALGWRVEVLGSGQAMLERLRSLSLARQALPDVLLVDWQMPELDGLSALGRVRHEFEGHRQPASLIVSAHERAEIAAHPQAVLADSILHKPVNPSELFNAVNTAVARQRGNTAHVLAATRIERVSGPWLQDLSILLVDDSEINLEVGRRLLEAQGARVRSAADGQEALEILQAEPRGFDAVLMDIQMPRMDGYEATRRLRQRAELRSLPVLALTASALVEERRKAAEAGMSDFLTKPLEPHELVRALRRSIESARGHPLPLAPASSPPRPGRNTWPRIEGIDTEAAAQRLGHDHALFLSMLRRLLREYPPESLLPDEGEPDAAERSLLAARLHKLRGSAGLIGADGVQSVAAEAEAVLRGDPVAAPVAPQLQRLARSLSQLAEAATDSLAAEAAALAAAQAAERSQDLALDRARLENLRQLLQEQDLTALDEFRSLAPALASRLEAEHMSVLRQAVEDLDFENALRRLDLLLPPEP